MAIFDEHFSHSTIRMYTSAFGMVFANLKIKREGSNKLIRVPIASANQEKNNADNDRDKKDGKAKVRFTLPRMAFRLTGWEKDSERITNKSYQLYSANKTANGVTTQYNRVPYNFKYELTAQTTNIEDMLQIVEQIIVYFNPTVQLVIQDNPDIEGDTAINIKLEDSQFEDDNMGVFDQPRTIQTTFNFSLEGYLYMPSAPIGLIHEVIINYHDLAEPDQIIQTDIYT